MTERADVITIETVVLRCGIASLEGAFLKELLEHPSARTKMERAIRERLQLDVPVKFTDREINWQFVSAARLKKPKAASEEGLLVHHQKLLRRGTLFFNVGDDFGIGGIDHHEDTYDQPVSAIDLLMTEDHSYLDALPWLLDIWKRISENDVDGTRIADGNETLRSLMSALACFKPGDSRFSHHVLGLAFKGAFKLAEEGVDGEEALQIAGAIKGLAKINVFEAEELAQVWADAQKSVEKDQEQAEKDVEAAVSAGNFKELDHPWLSRRLERGFKALWIESGAVASSFAARKAGYDVVIIFRTDGSAQIFGRNMFRYEHKKVKGKMKKVRTETWRFDLGAIASRLRLAEGKVTEQHLEEGDWKASGFVYDRNGVAIPWYLANFKKMLANRTLGSPNVPVTQLTREKIVEIVVENLTSCTLLKLDKKSGEYVGTSWSPPRRKPKRPQGRNGNQRPRNGNKPSGQSPHRDTKQGSPPRPSSHSTDGEEGLTHGMAIKPVTAGAEK